MVSIKVSGVPWRKSIGRNRRSCRNVYPAMSEEGAPLSAKTNRCVVRKTYGFTQGQRMGRHWLTLLSGSSFLTRVAGDSIKMASKVERTRSQFVAKLGLRWEIQSRTRPELWSEVRLWKEGTFDFWCDKRRTGTDSQLLPRSPPLLHSALWSVGRSLGDHRYLWPRQCCFLILL